MLKKKIINEREAVELLINPHDSFEKQSKEVLRFLEIYSKLKEKDPNMNIKCRTL